MSKKDIQIVSNVRKSAEYQAFIKLIKRGNIPANWVDMAEALGVHANTISEWKKLPEFQEALIAGIQESLEMMSTVGKRDWRMWRDKYSLLTKEADKQGANVQINFQGLIQVNINEED